MRRRLEFLAAGMGAVLLGLGTIPDKDVAVRGLEQGAVNRAGESRVVELDRIVGRSFGFPFPGGACFKCADGQAEFRAFALFLDRRKNDFAPLNEGIRRVPVMLPSFCFARFAIVAMMVFLSFQEAAQCVLDSDR